MGKICGAPACSNVRPCVDHNYSPASSRGWKWATVTAPAILERDGHACVLCGRPCPHPHHHHVDHIKRREFGGTDEPSNLRTICASANLKGECR